MAFALGPQVRGLLLVRDPSNKISKTGGLYRLGEESWKCVLLDRPLIFEFYPVYLTFLIGHISVCSSIFVFDLSK